MYTPAERGTVEDSNLTWPWHNEGIARQAGAGDKVDARAVDRLRAVAEAEDVSEIVEDEVEDSERQSGERDERDALCWPFTIEVATSP